MGSQGQQSRQQLLLSLWARRTGHLHTCYPHNPVRDMSPSSHLLAEDSETQRLRGQSKATRGCDEPQRHAVRARRGPRDRV